MIYKKINKSNYNIQKFKCCLENIFYRAKESSGENFGVVPVIDLRHDQSFRVKKQRL